MIQERKVIMKIFSKKEEVKKKNRKHVADRDYIYIDKYRISADNYQFILEVKNGAGNYGDNMYHTKLSSVIKKIGILIVRDELPDLEKANK